MQKPAAAKPAALRHAKTPVGSRVDLIWLSASHSQAAPGRTPLALIRKRR
jgi:hypothetical protein